MLLNLFFFWWLGIDLEHHTAYNMRAIQSNMLEVKSKETVHRDAPKKRHNHPTPIRLSPKQFGLCSYSVPKWNEKLRLNCRSTTADLRQCWSLTVKIQHASWVGHYRILHRIQWLQEQSESLHDHFWTWACKSERNKWRHKHQPNLNILRWWNKLNAELFDDMWMKRNPAFDELDVQPRCAWLSKFSAGCAKNGPCT